MGCAFSRGWSAIFGPTYNIQVIRRNDPTVPSQTNAGAAKSHSPMAVRFNVGGRLYEVARSTLELHPNTMLARMVDKIWEHEGHEANDALFIDRNGDRFQYVLDWMRDGSVHVPVTESRAAVWKELEYYGFENVKETTILAGTLDGSMLTNVSGNMIDEVDQIDATISMLEAKVEEQKSQRASIKAAHSLFLRSAGLEAGHRATITLKDTTEIQDFGKARAKGAGLDKCLSEYGLILIEAPQHIWSYDKKVSVVVKRQHQVK